MYYIYHIPGIKIGCTKNLNNRIKQQTKGEWEVLEQHLDIHTASEREITLQKEYGYKVDTTTYHNSTKSFKAETTIKAGKASALKQWKLNRNELIERSKLSKPVMIEKYGKDIIQYDLDNNFIKEWKGIKEVARSLNIKPPNLTACLNNRQKTSGGFIWKYKKRDN